MPRPPTILPPTSSLHMHSCTQHLACHAGCHAIARQTGKSAEPGNCLHINHFLPYILHDTNARVGAAARPTHSKEGVWGQALCQRLEQAHLRDVQALSCAPAHSPEDTLHLWGYLASPCWNWTCMQAFCSCQHSQQSLLDLVCATSSFT